MVATPQVKASQLDVASVAEGAPDIRTTQMDVMAVAIWPTEFIEASQLDVTALTEAATTLKASQLDVMVVGRGRVQDPIIRAFGFWLDTHWFYCIRLPTGYTLLFDTFAEQWYIWSSGTGTSWRAYHGTNWLGSGPLMQTYGSNIVVGDDGNGALYMLNPQASTDDDAILGAELQRTYQREITGQVSVRSHNYLQCFGVELMGSFGDNDADLTDVTLYTSDDSGHTYTDMGTLTLDSGEYTAWANWLGGLGSFTAPGRLFKIRDDGALQRIDWLEMRGPQAEKNSDG